MQITERVKERFKRDCNLPLRLFREPYFMSRLRLYDPFFGTIDKWNLFMSELEQYPNDEAYFNRYNEVKDTAMQSIKEGEAFIRFNNEDMNQFALVNKGFPSRDVFHPQSIGKRFISVDMKKANFSSLKHYSRDIFGADTWEEFIARFTDSRYMQSSKYIREVILGNCNPKRHIAYEKHLMDALLTQMLAIVDPSQVVFFCNDEIVLDATMLQEEERKSLVKQVSDIVAKAEVPLRVEPFQLIGVINPTDDKIFGYMRDVETESGKEIDFKGLNNFILPFVMRKLLNQDVKDSDMVFEHEGMLATFMSAPSIEFVTEYDS